jgi:hypothetical protein
MRIELFALFLYCAVMLRMDKQRGFLTAAHILRSYASICRDLGNWAYTQAIRADNAARELVEP